MSEIVHTDAEGSSYVMGRRARTGKLVAMYKIISLQESIRDACARAFYALAFHVHSDVGFEVFRGVRPKLSNDDARTLYDDICSYVVQFMNRSTDDSDLMFCYRKGLSVETPCGICGRHPKWAIVTRPCGHVICDRHKKESELSCAVCKSDLVSVFSRDSVYISNALLDELYFGFTSRPSE